MASSTAAAVEEARRAGILVSTLDLGAAPYGPVRIASGAAPDRYLTAGAAGSWAIAYWAGRFALACQQDPSMTPERFARRCWRRDKASSSHLAPQVTAMFFAAVVPRRVVGPENLS